MQLSRKRVCVYICIYVCMYVYMCMYICVLYMCISLFLCSHIFCENTTVISVCGCRKPRLSDFPKESFFPSLRNARRIAKKTPVGIRELGLIHWMRINFGEASRAKLNDARGKKIEGWLSEGSIFRAKAAFFDPLGQLMSPTLRHTNTPYTYIRVYAIRS